MAKQFIDKIYFAKQNAKKKMMMRNNRNMQVSILDITEKAYTLPNKLQYLVC